MPENLWQDNTPAFSSNTYATFLTAELEPLNLPIMSLPRDNVTPAGSHFQSTSPPADALAKTSTTMYIFDIDSTDSDPSPDLQLVIPRAGCSRLLNRASALLEYHFKERIKVDPYLLCGLIKALTACARSELINPQDTISTHHPQSRNTVSPNYDFVIAMVSGTRLHFRSDNLDLGPLGTLIHILRMNPAVKGESLLHTRIAAMEAFSALVPVILQHVFQLDRSQLQKEFHYRAWPSTHILNVPGVQYDGPANASGASLSRTQTSRIPPPPPTAQHSVLVPCV